MLEKDEILYLKVDSELLERLQNMIRLSGEKESQIKIGDIVAIDEVGCRLSSKDEIVKIPKEKLVYVGPKVIITKK